MKQPRFRLIQIATGRHIACDAAGEISKLRSIVAGSRFALRREGRA
jgi:hypothetical protein